MTTKIQLKNFTAKKMSITNILKCTLLCTIFVNFCECIFISVFKIYVNVYNVATSLTHDILWSTLLFLFLAFKTLKIPTKFHTKYHTFKWQHYQI